MKKQVKKITLKTDKIVNLSTSQAQQIAGGKPNTRISCPDYCNLTITTL
jgi:hypothetical protein